LVATPTSKQSDKETRPLNPGSPAGIPNAHARVAVRLTTAAGAASAVANSLLEQREPSVARRLTARERRVESIMAALFALVAGALVFVYAGEAHHATTALLLVTTYAFVARVRFQLGPGLVRPTQLVLVPMVFLLAPPVVPALVAGASILSELPEVARRRADPERLLVAIADCWHTVGPAIVVTALGAGDPVEISWGLFAMALLSQFAVDFVASILREWLGAGIRPRKLAPVLAMVYLVDTLLAPIGLLAVLASREQPEAFLLAVAPGALLAVIARERRARIELDLTLGRAYRRSTRALDEQAQDLRREAGRLKRSDGVGDIVATAQDRGALERLLLTTTIEAVQADCGRLSTGGHDGTSAERVILSRHGIDAGALRAAEAALLSGAGYSQVTIGELTALAIPLTSQPSAEGDCLTVGRVGRAFSPAERELLEHLAAQAAVSLENMRLQGLRRKTEEELRAILQGVPDAVTAEDASGRLVYVNAAAIEMLGLGGAALRMSVGELVRAMRFTDEHGRPVALDRLPGRQALQGAPPEPLVLRYRTGGSGEPRCTRVKATPVFDERGHVRLAISVFEDITEIKQAEDAQRFLARSSTLLTSSLDVRETLPALARLVVPEIADWCAVHLLEPSGLRCVALVHRDPAKLPLAEALTREYPFGGTDEVGAPRVIRTGRPEIHTEVSDDLLRRAADTPRQLHLLRTLGMVSAMTVPLRARDHVLGAITLVTAESGRRLGHGDFALAEDLGLRAGTAVENARLYRTRSAIAQTLQASLLPPVLPEVPGIETAALFRAAGDGHEVGGDFYDVFSTGKRQWFAVMGDVCGKGAEAAAVTALARYTIRAAVVRHRSPAGILLWLNDAMLRQRLDPGRFATVACVRLDLDADGVTATVATGGHPCPRVLRATGLVEEFGVPGTLLGAVSRVRLEDRTTRLAPGDALVLFTDGLTEAGAPKRVWSPKQLDAVIAGARRADAQGIVDHLTQAALGDAAAPLRDDIALLVLRAR
jgi:PAS domain S-box-containing protein